MGLQLTCPLCGMTGVPDRFGAHDLSAKDVQSLGGNRGFDHVDVAVPTDLERQIERYIAELYHQYVQFDPYRPTSTVMTNEPSASKVRFGNIQTNVKFRPD